MSEVKFKLGPWVVQQPYLHDKSPNDVWHLDKPGENGGYIATIWTIFPRDEVRAIAHLIGAAPDLLAALEAHDRYMLDAGYSGPDSDALHPKAAENWRRARAAIAKARGE